MKIKHLWIVALLWGPMAHAQADGSDATIIANNSTPITSPKTGFKANLDTGHDDEPSPPFRRFFVGTSAFMLANLAPNPPAFFQLNAGYWLSPKDVLSIECKTWEYGHPLGIPYGPNFESKDWAYKGRIKAWGIGLAYQRYLYRGLYAAVHATPFLQQYLDEDRNEIQKGFQLFMTFRLGYHVRLFHDRFFIEPSIATTYWPINTNVPEAFRSCENAWPNYFLFEPGLHLGYKF